MSANYNYSIYLSKEQQERIKIWELTKKIIKEKFHNNDNLIQNNIFYNENKLMDIYKGKIPSADSPMPFIEVVNNDPLKEAKILVKKGYKTLVMNASKIYTNYDDVNLGKNTLEADIYIRTTLSKYINNNYYPLKYKSGILTKNVSVFRDIGPEYDLIKNNYLIDIFTIGVNINPSVSKYGQLHKYTYKHEKKEMRDKIELFFEVAFLNGYKAVVITDIGCRDKYYQHPIEEIAIMIHELSHKYRHHFDKIIITVMSNVDDYEDPTSINFELFSLVFNELSYT